VKHLKDVDRNRTGTVLITFATREDAEAGQEKMQGKLYKDKRLDVVSEVTFAASTELLICVLSPVLISSRRT
jgi:hypothetical protein